MSQTVVERLNERAHDPKQAIDEGEGITSGGNLDNLRRRAPIKERSAPRRQYVPLVINSLLLAPIQRRYGIRPPSAPSSDSLAVCLNRSERGFTIVWRRRIRQQRRFARKKDF